MQLALVVAVALCGLAPAQRTDPATTQSSGDQRSIIIWRAPPVVRRVMFDPAKPHAGVPTTRPNESAITEYRFNCRVYVECELISKSRLPDGSWNAKLRFENLRVNMALENVVYLPFNASLALRMHEESHREINERLYESTAEVAAREAGKEIVLGEQTVTVSDAEIESVVRDATKRAQEHIASSAQRAFAAEAERVATRFDRITDHGQREIEPNAAIEQAMRRD